MPRKCSVIGCRGNYAARKGEPADVNKVSVLHFPKDVSRTEQWLHRIPQELHSDDNNRINRNVFDHRLDSSRRLFFMFDSVHLLKSILTNWINQLDQTFHFPQVVGSTAKACFAYLNIPLNSERSAIVKLMPSLTFTALHHNNKM